MIAKHALIYAKGGGHGHAMRGARVAELLAAEGVESTLVIRAGSDRYLGASLKRETEIPETHSYDTLIVDTFPRGWKHELSDAFINSFQKKIFIARYNQSLDPAALDLFDEVWDPSPADQSEWTKPLPRVRSVGWLVRDRAYEFKTSARKFLLLDPSGHADELKPAFERIARESGFTFEARGEIPKTIEAEKVVIVGAGYNTFYELWNQRHAIRYIPLKRKYDDQKRRVELGQLGLGSLSDFQDWLQDGSTR